jgi:O-phosphoseryl-tRNA(Cys) synthetase
MIQRFFRRERVEQYLLLFFQYDRSTVVVAMQVQMDAVVHEISTA